MIKTPRWLFVRVYLFSTFLLLATISISGCERPGALDKTEGQNRDDNKRVEISARELVESPSYEPVIQIGSSEVTKQELQDSFMVLLRKPKASDTDDSAAERTLQLTALRNYLYLEAVDRDIDEDPDVARKWYAKSTLWVGDYFMNGEASKVSIDSGVLEALLPQNAYAFSLRTLSTDDLASAQDLRHRLTIGEEFGELARKYSRDPSAPAGGKISVEQVMSIGGSYYGDEVLEKLVSVEIGGFSNIIETPMGYTIFLVEGRRELNPDEIARIRGRIEGELRFRAVSGLRSSVERKYPMEIDEAALSSAIQDDAENNVVARVGEMEVTFGLVKGFSQLLHETDRPGDRDVHSWTPVLIRMARPLAYRQEAVVQGFLDDPVVQENLRRAGKYSLRESMESLLWKEAEPTEEMLFDYYMKEVVPGGSEGIFSVTGYQSPDEGKVLEVADLLTKGKDLEEAATLVNGGSAGEIITGTYQEDHFPRQVVIALEKTRAGEYTKVIKHRDLWLIFRLDGKDRAGAPPFESFVLRQKNQVHRQNYEKQRNHIVFNRNKREPIRFLRKEEAVKGLIAEWLHLQKALRGISPPGGFHNRQEGNDIILPGDGQKPSGHP